MINKGEYLMFYHDEMYEPLTELIESLRTVARAASRTCQTGELAEALDALPKWVLKKEE